MLEAIELATELAIELATELAAELATELFIELATELATEDTEEVPQAPLLAHTPSGPELVTGSCPCVHHYASNSEPLRLALFPPV